MIEDNVKSYYKKNKRRIESVWCSDENEIFGVEKGLVLFLLICRYFSIVLLVRRMFCNTYIQYKKVVDYWCVFKPMFLFCVVFILEWPRTIELFIAIFFLFDLYIALLGLVFLERFNSEPVSTNRNLILLNVNFIEFILAFAVIYLSVGGIENQVESVYFSITSATTVGFGDIIVTKRYLPIIQMLMSLPFLTILFSVFTARNTRKNT